MELRPIGFIRSPFPQKFGIPRQPELAPGAESVIRLDPEQIKPECMRGLDEVSHIWVLFHFHGVDPGDWRPTVRPPRLGGNRRLGVFASRSPFRPNPIGMSVVRLLRIHGFDLTVGGGDFLDGTPVLDIKPYVPYADSRPDARPGIGEPPIQPLEVTLSTVAEAELATHSRKDYLRALIEETLRWDPRPAYRQEEADDQRLYATRLLDVDVEWRVIGQTVVVAAIRM